MFSRLSRSFLGSSQSNMDSGNNTPTRPQAHRSSTTPISKAPPGVAQEDWPFNRTPTGLGHTRHDSKADSKPRFELAIAKDPVPWNMEFHRTEYHVFGEEEVEELEQQLLQSVGKLAAYELFPQFIKLLDWRLDGEDRGRKARTDALPFSSNPLRSKSVEDFFRAGDEEDNRAVRAAQRTIALPNRRDMEKHEKLCNDIRTDSFRPSYIWKPEPTAFDDPPFLMTLPVDKTFLLINKSTGQAYIRRVMAMTVYKVIKVKPCPKDEVHTDLEDERWTLL